MDHFSQASGPGINRSWLGFSVGRGMGMDGGGASAEIHNSVEKSDLLQIEGIDVVQFETAKVYF